MERRRLDRRKKRDWAIWRSYSTGNEQKFERRSNNAMYEKLSAETEKAILLCLEYLTQGVSNIMIPIKGETIHMSKFKEGRFTLTIVPNSTNADRGIQAQTQVGVPIEEERLSLDQEWKRRISPGSPAGRKNKNERSSGTHQQRPLEEEDRRRGTERRILDFLKNVSANQQAFTLARRIKEHDALSDWPAGSHVQIRDEFWDSLKADATALLKKLGG